MQIVEQNNNQQQQKQCIMWCDFDDNTTTCCYISCGDDNQELDVFCDIHMFKSFLFQIKDYSDNNNVNFKLY